ncbi:MAG: transposase, partial [Candidatus Omnitrophota bacterium]
LSESHLYAAMRYVERNPVRAGIVKKAQDYPWSSAKPHIKREKNNLLTNNFITSEIKDWASYLSDETSEKEEKLFKQHTLTGRPLGDKKFIEYLENLTGRDLKKKKPGPKKKNS